MLNQKYYRFYIVVDTVISHSNNEILIVWNGTGMFKLGRLLAPLFRTNLSKWNLKKLEIIARESGEFQIKNGKELSERIEGLRMDPRHVLVTFDYSAGVNVQ